ncbi:MAG: C39 family peptidase [Candidatus Thorarchaeota archaeon]|nr:C39 family peptidase [Candidatus Thorarchaeota archaeon]
MPVRRGVCILVCVVMLLSCSTFMPLWQSNAIIQDNPSGIAVAQSFDDEHMCLDVPWCRMIGSLGFSCPASLQMIFQYYGSDVDQSDVFRESFSTKIFEVDGGTNFKYFPRAACFQNYDDEEWGFQGTAMTLGHLTHEERLEVIKGYLREGIPVIGMCKKYSNWPSHYKLFIGFDDRSNDWFHNDPWYDTDGVDRCGPMSITSFDAGAHFDGTWNNTNYMIGLVLPIRMSLEIDNRPASTQSEFDLVCKLDTTHLELDSDITLNLTLPEGFSLVSGEELPTVPLDDENLEYTWRIESSEMENVEDKIRVLATVSRENYTTGGFDVINPYKPDTPSIQKPVSDQSDTPPFMFNVCSTIDCATSYSARVVSFSYSDSTRFYPKYYSANSFENEINCTLGNFRPGKTVFCWVEVSTPFGNYSSGKSVYLVQYSDWDNDGLEGYSEATRYGTNPNLNDTDFDFLSDYDEVKVYFTDPLLNDTDEDMLLDGLEIEAGTDPRNPDCDADGDLDGIEVQYGLDPLNPDSNVSTMTLQLVIIIGGGTVSGIVVVIALLGRKKA